MTRTISTVWSLLTADQRRDAVRLVCLMLLGVALEALSVGLIVPVLAVLTDPGLLAQYPWLTMRAGDSVMPDRMVLAITLALVLFGAYAAKNLLLAYLAWRQSTFWAELSAEISQRLLGVYLRQPYSFHLQRNSAQLFQNVMGEADVLAMNVIAPAMLLLSELLVLACLLTLVFWFQPVGTVVVVLVIGSAALFFVRLVTPHTIAWGIQRQHHSGQMVQQLQQGLGAVKDVKVLGREADFLHQYRVHRENNARVAGLQNMFARLPQLWLEVLAVGGLVALIVTMILRQEPLDAIVPTLGLFAAAAFRLTPSVNRMMGANQALRFGMPAVERLDQELGLSGDTVVAPFGRTMTFRKELRFEAVCFAYPSALGLAIQSISLKIPKGSSVGIVGASGAGKSTLLDIVLGLLTPDSGAVTVDGVDIQSCLREWQNNIGYVPQAIFLTDDSIRRNVAFGLPDDGIDEQKVLLAIQMAQLGQYVGELAQGLDTLVGERGIRLSSGQRQRLGIARALYHDPEVLVLDEATSALDADTENSLMELVQACRGDKTLLIVAHRPSTIAGCDLIFRLDRGQLIADPTAVVPS